MVNFVADRTQPQGMATVGYDDEGVPGQRWHLVKDGVFVDWQTTRDTGKACRQEEILRLPARGQLGQRSVSADAERFAHPAKENVSQDDLVAGVDKGILI